LSFHHHHEDSREACADNIGEGGLQNDFDAASRAYHQHAALLVDALLLDVLLLAALAHSLNRKTAQRTATLLSQILLR